MNFILDTDHWSYIQRRHPAVLARIAAIPRESVLYMSVVSQGEMLGGVESLPDGKRKAELIRLYEELFRARPAIIGIDSAVARKYASVVAQLRRAGRPIVTNDIWIGAAALEHNLVLVTNDAHFSSIEGLRTQNWTAPAI